MDAKEAIASIKILCAITTSSKNVNGARDMAIESLEKQVPAKIIVLRYDHEGKILNGDCPVCGQVSPHSDYCLDCGQKLDWASDKE